MFVFVFCTLWRRWASVLAELRSEVVFCVCVCVCVLYIVAEVGECFSGVEVRGCKSRREDGLSGLHAWDQGMLNVFNFYTLRTPTCN